MLFPFALLFMSSVSCILPSGARKFLIFLSSYSAVVLGFRGFNQSVRKGERLLDCAKQSGVLCRVMPEGWGIAWCKNQWIFCAGTRLVEIQEAYSHIGSIWRQPKSYTNVPSLLEPTNKRRTTKG